MSPEIIVLTNPEELGINLPFGEEVVDFYLRIQEKEGIPPENFWHFAANIFDNEGKIAIATENGKVVGIIAIKKPNREALISQGIPPYPNLLFLCGFGLNTDFPFRVSRALLEAILPENDNYLYSYFCIEADQLRETLDKRILSKL